MAKQVESPNGVVIHIPEIDGDIAISNGALKICGEILSGAERWTHENPLLFVAALVFLLIAAFFRTQRIKARVQMQRDFRAERARNRQLSLPFPRNSASSTSSKAEELHPGAKSKGDRS